MSLIWHPHQQPAAHPLVTLPHGLHYVGKVTGRGVPEPSAIIPEAAVADQGGEPSMDLPVAPSYELLNPAQRRAYLDWLAQGRRDAVPKQRAKGYLWLYLYGLERRVFVEQDQDPALRDELLELLKHYGPTMASRNLRGQMLSLFHAASCHMGADWYRALWPAVLNFDDGKTGEDEMQLVLANLHGKDEAMNWAIGYRLAMADSNTRRSVVVHRAQREFWALFQQRFEECYPAGLKLTPAKQDFIYRYFPAHPSLQPTVTHGRNSPYRFRVPNILGRHSQFKNIFKLWDTCVEDLSGYSRRLISKATDAAGLRTWLALPAALKKAKANPMQTYWDWVTQEAPREETVRFATVGGLAPWFGIEEKAVVSKSQSLMMAEGLADMGWNVVPHPSHVDLPYAWDQEVGLVPRSHEQPMEPSVSGLVRLMYLMTPVAAADGTVDDLELDAFRKHSAQALHVERDWDYLQAMERVLMRNTSVALRALPALAKRVKPGNRSAVLRLLILVAASDGEVTSEELKVLRRVARAFGLAATTILELLASDDAFKGVVVADGAAPRPASNAMSEADRIALLTLRTRDVVRMLSDSDLEEGSSEPEAVAPSLPDNEDWLAGLNAKFRPLVTHITQRDEVPLEDFEKLAAKHGLSVDAAFALVNGWADTQLGDSLLEMSNPVRVYRNLIPGFQ